MRIGNDIYPMSPSKIASMNGGNRCVICLDPLMLPPLEQSEDSRRSDDNICDLGVATPCGHPLHGACFKEWSSFQAMRENFDIERNQKVPCPTCNQPIHSFVKVFMKPELPTVKQVEEHNIISPELLELSKYFSDEDKDDKDDNVEILSNLSRLVEDMTNSSASSPHTKRRRGKRDRTQKKNLRDRQKTATDKSSKSVQKKNQKYKFKLLEAIQQIRNLEKEKKRRRDCHHADLQELRQTQCMNRKLLDAIQEQRHEQERKGKWRKIMGALCFGVGWWLNSKLHKYWAQTAGGAMSSAS